MPMHRRTPSIALPAALAFLLSTFAVGASPTDVAAGVDGVILTKTVMIDPTPEDPTDGICATESSIQVAQGTVVDYCFRIQNTSNVALTTHNLVDAELGTILSNFGYILQPDASAFITQPAVVNQTTTASATWTATAGPVTHADSASTTVTVNGPALTLRMGVMVDATPANDNDDLCSPTTAIQVPASSAGTEIDWCFEIENHTNQILDRHDLTASGFGSILTDFAYNLYPNASAFIVQSANVTYLTDQRSATWTAQNVDESYGAPASALVTVLLPFTDIASSGFVGDIVWLEEQAITNGCAVSPPRFCPNNVVTRAQMASFLSRALSLPATAVDFFTDDETSTHEADINRIAAAGITLGCSATRFCPTSPVTRAQMASFLARAYSLPATATDFFSDDETSPHEADINRIAAAGITLGCSATRFCPTNPVTRGQMAAFLHRAET